jgi:hypothetical protein
MMHPSSGSWPVVLLFCKIW